jgi:deazaflavin-dependent oxidoreductase (nitroreductase family)
MSQNFTVWLVTNPVSTWLIRNIASPLDPLVFKATNGRYFTMGRASQGMATITMTGRRSGKPRAVHLACVPHEDDHLLVASAMGQQKHPGWRYNLEANPNVEVQMPGERFAARAEVLSDDEKASVWDKIRTVIPMIHVYETRTDRNIRVFRLVRLNGSTSADAGDPTPNEA